MHGSATGSENLQRQTRKIKAELKKKQKQTGNQYNVPVIKNNSQTTLMETDTRAYFTSSQDQ